MTVAELIEKLKECQQDAEVSIEAGDLGGMTASVVTNYGSLVLIGYDD
jgi:hypothetical protein